MKKIVIAVFVIVAFICLIGTPASQAQAACPLSTATVQQNNACSLPYVVNCEQISAKKCLVEINVAGNPVNLTVKQKGKKVRVYQIDGHTWSFELKVNKLYIIKAKAADGTTKTIEYKVRR